MSIDLSRPLVPSMGQHDPLDGLITYRQLQSVSADTGDTLARGGGLAREIEEMRSLCEGVSWKTGDPLGIGGLLTEACRLAQLIVGSGDRDFALLLKLVEDGAPSLAYWELQHPLDASLPTRLAFRELGLSIGLHAVERMEDLMEQRPPPALGGAELHEALARLARFVPLAGKIEEFWLRPVSQQCAGWIAHREINSVMLATSLGPDAYLRLN